MKLLTTIFLSLFLVTSYAEEPTKKEGTVVNGMRLAKKKEDTTKNTKKDTQNKNKQKTDKK